MLFVVCSESLVFVMLPGLSGAADRHHALDDQRAHTSAESVAWPR
jgi:hypothetical protein